MQYNGNGMNGAISSVPQNHNTPDGNSDQEIDLIKVFNQLMLHKWILIGFLVIGTALSVVFALIQTPIYRSEGTILISESKNRYSYAGSDLANLLTTTYGIGVGSTIANELQILKSNKLAFQLAEKINAVEFDETGRKFPILWRSYPDDSTSTSLDTIATRYKELISFSQIDPEADLVSISFESPSPVEAAYIVNLTMDSYSNLSTDQNRTMAVSALSFLRNEKERIEKSLSITEDSLRRFMNETQLVSVDPQAQELITTISKLESEKQEIEVNLVAVNSAITQYENQLDEIKPGLADQYSDAIGSTLQKYQYTLSELETEKLLLLSKNPELRTNPNHPELVRIDGRIAEVKSQIKSLTDKLLNSKSNIYLSFINAGDGSVTNRIAEISEKLIELKVEQAQYQTQTNVLAQRTNELNKRFEELPDGIIELAKLKRDVKINEELFLLVSQQYSEMSLWEKTQFGLGRPLDYAQPPLEPVKPKKKIIVIIGFLISGILGVGFIFVKELLNDRITSLESIKEFKVPVLGSVPDYKYVGHIDPNERKIIEGKSVSKQLITFLDHISPISESFRRLRINVVYANPDKQYKVLMVTSATKGEGKSTIAANLAITFSEAEKSVLIIDLDLRRPTQHKIFGENREPGLTDILFESISLSSVIRSTIAPNVDLLTVGKKTPEPASVLDSKRLKQLIDKLSDKYDHIILDTAPYGIIADSASLLRLVDGLIVVSRFNVTTKRELAFTLEGLRHLNADILGVAMNAFNPKKSNDYYTNYYYYKRTYSEYYKD